VSRLRRWAAPSTIVAVGLVLLIAFFVLGTLSFSTGEVTSIRLDVTPGSIERVRLGASREDAERVLGSPGQDALEFATTGVAVEPMDADCVYYLVSAGVDGWDVLQLCYRDDRLVSRQRFSTPSPSDSTG
jgi:hypothetical protein